MGTKHDMHVTKWKMNAKTKMQEMNNHATERLCSI